MNAGISPDRSASILWWGRFDPEYSRNRVMRALLETMGWANVDYRPAVSPFGALEATLRRVAVPRLVWVPCFRQRDVQAARRWCNRHGVPLLFDPLISAYDKQVLERKKFLPTSARARWLLSWERRVMQQADLVLADTAEHARFFSEVLGVSERKLFVVPVGAEERLFHPGPNAQPEEEGPLRVLFYGSFIHLQGPQVIAEAARLYHGPPVIWSFVGNGPLLKECKRLVGERKNVTFEEWIPYGDLPDRIHAADVLLGVFGQTPKADRVIPNKVYQAMACGKPVVTRRSGVYPEELLAGDRGIFWTEAGNAGVLAETVAQIAAERDTVSEQGRLARASYERYFSRKRIQADLERVLRAIPS